MVSDATVVPPSGGATAVGSPAAVVSCLQKEVDFKEMFDSALCIHSLLPIYSLQLSRVTVSTYTIHLPPPTRSLDHRHVKLNLKTRLVYTNKYGVFV